MSYNDVRKMSIFEKNELIKLIIEENEKSKELIDRAQQERLDRKTK